MCKACHVILTLFHFILFDIFCLIITDRGLHHIADYILSFLDAKSLCQAELVCVGWKRRISDGMLWKKLIEKKAKSNSLWKGLSVRRGW